MKEHTLMEYLSYVLSSALATGFVSLLILLISGGYWPDSVFIYLIFSTFLLIFYTNSLKTNK